MPKNAIDTIYDRRSIRKYLDKEVNSDLVQEVLRAGIFAPSAANKQPYHFIVFDNKEKIAQIKEIHPYAKTLETAPICIMVCGDTQQQMAEGFYICDCSAVCENILLAAEALGLNTCWMGIYPWKELTDNMAKFLDLPDNVKPFAIIALGYGAVDLPRAKRFDETKIHYNNW